MGAVIRFPNRYARMSPDDIMRQATDIAMLAHLHETNKRLAAQLEHGPLPPSDRAKMMKAVAAFRSQPI